MISAPAGCDGFPPVTLRMRPFSISTTSPSMTLSASDSFWKRTAVTFLSGGVQREAEQDHGKPNVTSGTKQDLVHAPNDAIRMKIAVTAN